MKTKIYETLIRSTVTHSSETWVLKKENENNSRFERKIIRKIYKPIKQEEQWRIRNNEEIDEILKQEDIVRFIKTRRIDWLGHV
jgi:hypothetical protein